MSNKVLVPIIVLVVLLLAVFLIAQLPVFDSALQPSLAETYINEESGFAVSYPEEWNVDDSAPFVTFITREPLTGDPEQEVVGFAIYPIPTERITEAMGRSPEDVTLQELWDQTAPPNAEEVESFSVDGEEGIRGRIEDAQDDVRSWVVLTKHSDITYMIIGVTHPASLWEEYEPTFSRMLDSFQFVEP